MVNPVNNNLPTEYQPSAGKTVKVDNEEHFSLGSALNENKQMHDGVLYESSEKKDSGNSNNSAGGSSGTGSQSRDTFESSLDKAVLQREQDEKYNSAFRESVKALIKNVGTFFSSLWFNIRKIFGNVWESKPLAEGVESIRRDNSTASSATTATDSSISTTNTNNDATGNTDTESSIDQLENERDNKIRQALSEGNRDEFRTLISEDGKKQPARNTTMLTTYDSKGKLVNIDPSDENKILHGDRGTRKL